MASRRPTDGGFRAARNAALRSLDEAQIVAYSRRYGVPMPADRSPDGPFWAGLHKARVACLDLTDEERETSRRWLAARGYGQGTGGVG
jgi:hypothetical protein